MYEQGVSTTKWLNRDHVERFNSLCGSKNFVCMRQELVFGTLGQREITSLIAYY